MQAERSPSALHWLLGMAAFVVIVAGMKAAQAILIPFLLALLVSIICYPSLAWMQRKRIPTVVALLLIIGVVGVAVLGVVAVVGGSVRDFTGKMGVYQARLEEEKQLFYSWLELKGIPVSDELKEGNFDPKYALQMFGALLAGLGGAFGNVFLVLLMVVFMLLEATTIPRKLSGVGTHDQENLQRVERIRATIWNYVTIKTWISLLTGALVTLLMWCLRVDYALMWGLLAFCFNFIPNIGSIMAAIPAVVLALLQRDVNTAVYAAIGYLVINVLLGNLIEPRVMGRGMGLSTLVVFLSLIFWGWVLGPVGMILSVPLTMILKILLESSDQTRWVAVLLGNEAEKPAAA